LDFTFLILDVYGELCESLVVYEQEELGTISLPDIAVVVTLHNSLVVLLFLFI
jgi:hypothetical protein